MQNNISTSIHKCRAIEGRLGKISNGYFAVIDMDRASLFFESAGDMVSMAHMLLDLAEQLAEKQKEQGNA